MSDNVIKFPRRGNDQQAELPTTMDDAYVQIREVRAQYIEESMEDVIGTMASIFNQFGFKLGDSREDQKAWYLLLDGIVG